MQDSPVNDKRIAELLDADPARGAFQPPRGQEIIAEDGQAQGFAVSAVVGFFYQLFSFREVANTPGRTHEQAVKVTIPPDAGWFMTINYFEGLFIKPDGNLTERPLGGIYYRTYVEERNGAKMLVCRVRLTDSNQDDPIAIGVGVGLVTIT